MELIDVNINVQNVKYHVSAGAFGIYAGRINKKGDKWLEKSDVTDEALCAVRDYLYDQAVAEGKSIYGYEWDRKDGKIVELIVKIRDGENNA